MVEEVRIYVKDGKKLAQVEQFAIYAFKKAIELKLKKIHDYNSGDVVRADYYLHGEHTLIDELWKKMLRLISLNSSKESPMNEKIEDTLLDIMNFSADYFSYLMMQDGVKNKESDSA